MKTHILILFLALGFLAQSQIVNIPDTNFKNALLNHDPIIDTNNDNEIQVSEAEALLILNVQAKSISSLEGLHSFINIDYLDCSYNNLNFLDISLNTNLISLFCSGNEISSLDISQNVFLKWFRCSFNNLTNLDVSQNLSLEWLICGTNNLSSLDISNNTNLKTIKCIKNQITSLDTSQNPNLEILWCYANLISNLDISTNPNISRFLCYDNQLVSLNVNNGNNNILELFISKNNPALQCIQVDDVNSSNNQVGWVKDITANYSEDCELSTEDFSSISFKIYPNPASELLFISSENTFIKSSSVYSISGKKVIEQTNESNSIDVSGLSKGVYFLEIVSSGEKLNKKFIKK